MKDIEQVAVLLGAAERDFSDLRAMGENPDFADEIFGFHAQQTAEKAFKVWLATLGEDYPLTHDLVRLLKMLMERSTDAERYEPLADYGPYAVQFRYLVDPDIEPLDRKSALKHLEELMEHVRSMFAGLREADGGKWNFMPRLPFLGVFGSASAQS